MGRLLTALLPLLYRNPDIVVLDLQDGGGIRGIAGGGGGGGVTSQLHHDNCNTITTALAVSLDLGNLVPCTRECGYHQMVRWRLQ